MVQFGCPKHQKVYQGHKKVPCEFRTRPQTTRKFAQLTQPSPNKKWKPLAPHQLLSIIASLKTEAPLTFVDYGK